MTPEERNKFRPETVKRNILGCIESIRGMRARKDEIKEDAFIGAVSHMKKEIRRYWAERKKNRWTN